MDRLNALIALLETKVSDKFDEMKLETDKNTNDIDLFKKKILSLNNIIDSKSQQNQLFNYRISNFNYEIPQQKFNIAQLDYYLVNNDSIGFLTKEEQMMISDCIAKDKKTQWKLLYNPCQGRDTVDDCYAFCYNFKSLLVLIETDKGCKFGGYTSVGWEIPPSDGLGNINIINNKI